MSDDGAFLLQTLGRACLIAPSGRVALGPGKPYALLVYTALAPRRTVGRDELLDLLWPNLPPDRARATLRQTLSHLRAVLGERVLLTEGGVVRVDGSLGVDCLRFEAHIRNGELRDALAVYEGPFLNTVVAPNADELERWATVERERLAAAWARVMEQTIRHALDERKATTGVELAERLRQAMPHRQSAWRLLLEAYESAGDLHGALTAADVLESLASSGELELEASTRSSVGRLRERASRPVPEKHEGIYPELVGRDGEFGRLVAALARAMAGSVELLHVVGEAGAGKSRLLAEFSERLRIKRVRAVHVSAHAAEQAVPYALAADLASGVGRMPGALGVSKTSSALLVAMAPQLSSSYPNVAAEPLANPVELARQRSLALAELLSAVANEAPLVVLVDDLHWADAASLQMLGAACRRAEGSLLVVTASRSMEHPFEETTASLVLPALSSDAIAALVTSAGVDLSPATLQRVVESLARSSAGLPFLVIQSIELALERGVLRAVGDSISCANPESLVSLLGTPHAVASRLATLADGERRVLMLLVAADCALDVGTLARAIGHSTAEAEAACLALSRRHLAVRMAGGWRPGHERISDAAREHLTDDSVRALRIEAAMALLCEPLSDDRVRIAIRLLLRVRSDREISIAVRRWVAVRRGAGDRRHPREIIAGVLPPGTASDAARLLARSVPARVWIRRATAAGALVAFAAAGVAYRVTTAVHGPELYILQAPSVLDRMPTEPAQVLMPAPTVELRDAGGALDTLATDSVRVRLVQGTGTVGGDTIEPIVKGRAVFPSTSLESHGPVVLQFQALRSRAVARMPLDLDHTRNVTLHLESADFGRQHLGSTGDSLVLQRGERVSGHVSVEYSTVLPDATIWFAGTPTWGSPSSEFVSFGALSTPTRDRRRDEAVTLTAPDSAGEWYFVMAAAPESNAAFLMSSTNWRIGSPVWGDGNDIARLPPEQLRVALRNGWARLQVLRNDTGTPAYSTGRIAVTGFRVVVR